MSTRAKNVGNKIIKAANGIVNFAALVAVLALFAFGCYALWDSAQVYNAANALQYEVYRPRVEDEGKSFAELQAMNPEVFSWLTVYGTNIDYPVAQGEDNMKYVNTNAQGEYSLSGSIFLDSGNANDFSNFNSILYGHHMEKQAMFGEIGLFAEQSYFESRMYGNLYYEGQNHGLAFFAFLHVDAYDYSVFTPNIQGAASRQKYLDNLLSKAKFTRSMGITTSDRILLLSTCSSDSTNGRDILVAKITDERYDDTFEPAETTANTIHTAVDGQPGIWA
ncbi:MAG: class B sortase, partial [Oscillospiraceae bacterium]